MTTTTERFRLSGRVFHYGPFGVADTQGDGRWRCRWVGYRFAGVVDDEADAVLFVATGRLP